MCIYTTGLECGYVLAIGTPIFCSDIDLIISDEIMMPDDTFTHMSERWHTTLWLDHCVSSGDGHTVIKYMAVLYSTCCSDHILITVDI